MGAALCGSGGGADDDSFNYEAQLRDDRTGGYSVTLPNPDEHKGETAIYRHPSTASSPLVTAVYPDEPQPVLTIWQGFQRGCRLNPFAPCFGTRPFLLQVESTGAYQLLDDGTPARGDFVWSSYGDVDKEAREVGAGLRALSVEPRSNIGLWSVNRHEWVAAALGLWSQSMRAVALYDSLGAEACAFIVRHADLRCLFVSKQKLPSLLPLLSSISISYVIQFDVDSRWSNVQETVDAADVQAFAALGVKLISYAQLRQLGRDRGNLEMTVPLPEDIAYVMYTSGTTGDPKGAVLLHNGLCSSIQASRASGLFSCTESDVHLSYLPLAHIFESSIMSVFLFAGARIGFSTGVVKRLTEDMQRLRPTALFGVPRVFQRIHQAVFANIDAAGGLKARLAKHAYHTQLKKVRQGKNIRGAFLAGRVFGAVRSRVGLDRCRLVLTGAAPCPPYLMDFLRILLEVPVVQGYGMTESHCAISATHGDEATRGHVGAVMPCCEVKLVSVPELGYLASDKPLPRGEIHVRGPQVFVGYYKNEESSRDSLRNGWLATGDVGRFNANGSLSIVDRAKNIFKLSQGEYVAAERVESFYSKSPAVSAVMIYGNSFKSFLLGIASPAVEYWLKLMTQRGWWDGKARLGEEAFPSAFAAAWAAHAAELRAELISNLRQQETGLLGFERVRDWLVVTEVDKDGAAFTPANSLMTPTFKLRRPQMLHRYVRQLKELYAANGEPTAADEHWPGE